MYLNIIFNQCVVFPPLMIEQNIPSMLRHNNVCNYWNTYFENYESERDKYMLMDYTTYVIDDNNITITNNISTSSSTTLL